MPEPAAPGAAAPGPAQRRPAQRRPAQRRPAQKRPAQRRPAQKRPGQPPQGRASGTPSSVAETTRYLKRITELNPALGAVITVSPDAMDEAAARDQQQPRPGRRPGTTI